MIRLVVGLVLAVVVAAMAVPATAAAAPRASLPDIEDEVMCVECGTALNISQAPSAERQRAFIRRRIAEGRTKAEIKDALVAEYGPTVLGTPSDRGFGIANWLVPLLLAVGAILALAVTAGRWRRAGALRTDPAEDPPDSRPDLEAQDARRLERDMASYDL